MSKTKTYIEIVLDKSASIISCMELMESIKNNNIVEKVQIFSETRKDRSLTYNPLASYSTYNYHRNCQLNILCSSVIDGGR